MKFLKLLKYYYIMIPIVALLFYLFLPVKADAKTLDQTQLKDIKLDIIEYRLIKGAIEFDYITKKISTLNIIKDEDNYSSVVKNNNKYRIYNGDQFYYNTITEEWYEIEHKATTTIELFNDNILKLSLFQFIFGRSVNALNYYSETSDGYVENTDTGWATTHDAATGDGTNNANHEYTIAKAQDKGSSVFHIIRGFYEFDLSGGTDNVDSVSLFVYGWSVNGADVSAQQGTQGASLGTDDFDAFSGNTFGTENAWSAVAYNEIVFNQTGIDYIASVWGSASAYVCTREYNYDYLDVEPTGLNLKSGGYFSDEEGTSKDPYLEITVSSTTPPVQTASSSVNGSEDLTIIEGTIHERTASGTLIQFKRNTMHIPFFYWFIIAVPTLWIGGRIVIEFIIKLRKLKK